MIGRLGWQLEYQEIKYLRGYGNKCETHTFPQRPAPWLTQCVLVLDLVMRSVLIHPYTLLPAPWLTHCGIVLVLGRMEVADQIGFPRRNRAMLA